MKKNYFLAISILSIIFVSGQNKSNLPLRISKKTIEEFSLNKQSKIEGEISTNTSQERLVNYNPIAFDYSKAQSISISKDIDDLSKVSVFTVYHSDPNFPEQEIFSIKNSDAKLELTSKAAKNGNGDLAYENLNDYPTLNTYIQTTKNASGNSFSKGEIVLGNFSNSTTKATKGGLMEILVYNGVVRGKARQAIESSLALKYGITLTNGLNYISSEKKIVYAVEENNAFSTRIAGIGRDDIYELFQKQSKSTQPNAFVAIGLDQLFPSNQQNTSILSNQNFLVWGDNDGAITLSAKDKQSLPLMQRLWKIKPTGSEITSLETSVELEANEIFKEQTNRKAEDFLLVIDKSGKGSFLPENSQYIVANTNTNGIIQFSKVKWDGDQSGNDVFTFALRDQLNVEAKEGKTNNCGLQNNGVVEFTTKGGVFPIAYELKKEGQTIKTWKSTDNLYQDNRITDLPAGKYTISSKDVLNSVSESSVSISSPTAVQVNLGPDKRLEYEQTNLVLEATTSPADAQNLTYAWTSTNGFTSNQSKVYVQTPGTYTVTVTTDKGCSSTDTIVVNESYVRNFTLSPNRSVDGNYEIYVELSTPMDFYVEVYDQLGNKVDAFKGNEDKLIKSSIKGKKIIGLYTVVIFNSYFKVSKKLIVG